MGGLSSAFRQQQGISVHPHLPGRAAGHAQPGMVLQVELPSDGGAGICDRTAQQTRHHSVRAGMDRADIGRLPWPEHAGLPRGGTYAQGRAVHRENGRMRGQLRRLLRVQPLRDSRRCLRCFRSACRDIQRRAHVHDYRRDVVP